MKNNWHLHFKNSSNTGQRQELHGLKEATETSQVDVSHALAFLLLS